MQDYPLTSTIGGLLKRKGERILPFFRLLQEVCDDDLHKIWLLNLQLFMLSIPLDLSQTMSESYHSVAIHSFEVSGRYPKLCE